MYCCCVCNCDNSYTREYTCCGVCPIRCGVVTIGVFTIFVTLFLVLESCYQLLNDEIDWWYVFIGVLLCIPIIVASGIFVALFVKDSHQIRGLLVLACLLAITTLFLTVAWNIVYFTLLYKSVKVTTGNDGIGYVRQTVK